MPSCDNAIVNMPASPQQHKRLWSQVIKLVCIRSISSPVTPLWAVKDAATAKVMWVSWTAFIARRGWNNWITELVIKGLLVHPSLTSDLRMTCGLEVLMHMVTRHQGASFPYLWYDHVIKQSTCVQGILNATSVILRGNTECDTNWRRRRKITSYCVLIWKKRGKKHYWMELSSIKSSVWPASIHGFLMLTVSV